MNYNALSLEQTPPLSVPFRYFLTAPLFGIAAALLLLVYGTDAFASRWAPPLLAATHFLTLGFMAMTMIGAMQQLLPVLAGSPITRPGLVSRLLHLSLTLGTLSLGFGLLSGRAVLLGIALLFLLSLVAGFVTVAALSLARARSGHDTVQAMKQAVAGLAVTGLIGFYLVVTHLFPSLPVARHLTDLHLSWGLLGWAGLLVAGVAYQVVPMFQLTANYPKALTASLTKWLFIGIILWTVFSFSARLGASLAGAAAAVVGLLIAAGFVLFAVTTLRLQQRRRRRLPDVTLSYWRVGMASLLAAVVLWLLGRWWPAAAGDREIMMGLLLIVGFGGSVISGMLYKIVPFLVWLHLNNRLQAAGRWQGRIPNMKQIIPERRARAQFWAHTIALLALVAAARAPSLIYPAAFAALLSQAALFGNLLQAALLFRRVASQVAAAAEGA